MHASWQPSASLSDLRKRAQLLAKVRSFFVERNYLEVQTPIMAKFGVTDRYLENIQAVFRKQHYALQTSPEYHMKRLLAAGSGPIFQLFQAFRDDELGRWHNPEFTMLEWYKLDADHLALLSEVEAFVRFILDCPPFIKKTYREVFVEYCEINPFTATVDELRQVVSFYNLGTVLKSDESNRDLYLFLLMTHVIEPAFQKLPAPIAVVDFPPSQAFLSQVIEGFAQRFEVYYQGVELANGFHELTDVGLQKARFEADNAERLRDGLLPVAVDQYLLDALSAGLPKCSGVALGIDRLFAFALGKTSIKEVLAFDHARA